MHCSELTACAVHSKSLLPPCLPWLLQLVNLLVSGSRLEIPPLEQLPGSDTPQFAGLDAYVALMRWVLMLLLLHSKIMA